MPSKRYKVTFKLFQFTDYAGFDYKSLFFDNLTQVRNHLLSVCLYHNTENFYPASEDEHYQFMENRKWTTFDNAVEIAGRWVGEPVWIAEQVTINLYLGEYYAAGNWDPFNAHEISLWHGATRLGMDPYLEECGRLDELCEYFEPQQEFNENYLGVIEENLVSYRGLSGARLTRTTYRHVLPSWTGVIHRALQYTLVGKPWALRSDNLIWNYKKQRSKSNAQINYELGYKHKI